MAEDWIFESRLRHRMGLEEPDRDRDDHLLTLPRSSKVAGTHHTPLSYCHCIAHFLVAGRSRR